MQGNDFNETIDRIIEQNTRVLSNEYIIGDFVDVGSMENSSPSPIHNNQSSEGFWKYLEYVCGKCGVCFRDETQLQNHIDKKHPELNSIPDLQIDIKCPSLAECLICGSVFSHSCMKDLQLHYLQHLQFKTFKCTCHGHYFINRSMARAHLQMSHQTINGKAIIAKSPIKTQPNTVQTPSSSSNKKKPKFCLIDSQMGNHWTTSNPPAKEKDLLTAVQLEIMIKYTCPECGEDFLAELEWRNHCNDIHDYKTMEGLNMLRLSDTKSRCTICNRDITIRNYDTYKLRRHKFTHSPFKPYSCKMCNYSRKRKDDVVTHIRHDHGKEIREKLEKTENQSFMDHGEEFGNYDDDDVMPITMAETIIKTESISK